MKLTVRRVGNSLGVILPKATLDAWGVEEGGYLELSERDIRPASRGGFTHHELRERLRADIDRDFKLAQASTVKR